jgi:hypothetical protein
MPARRARPGPAGARRGPRAGGESPPGGGAARSRSGDGQACGPAREGLEVRGDRSGAPLHPDRRLPVESPSPSSRSGVGPDRSFPAGPARTSPKF